MFHANLEKALAAMAAEIARQVEEGKEASTLDLREIADALLAEIEIEVEWVE